MKQIFFVSLCFCIGFTIINNAQAQVLGNQSVGKGVYGKSIGSGSGENTEENERPRLPPPMTFELSGIVEFYSPSALQIGINGQTFTVAPDVTVYNLVDRSPVAPIKIGSKVGYEANEQTDGSFLINTLWVLTVPE